MHYSVHNPTAAELVVEWSDANKEHMGLTSWEKYPNGKILKKDVCIAKNYLNKDEIKIKEVIECINNGEIIE